MKRTKSIFRRETKIMKAHKNIAYTLIPNPGLEEKNPHKENYWVK